MNIFKIVVLALSGLALVYASSMRLIHPTKAIFLKTYLENPENTLEKDIDLANEIRGMGSVLLLGGIITLLGIILPDLRKTSFVVASVIFVGVVSGRLISLGVEGIPNPEIVRATMVEGVLGALNIVCLVNSLDLGS